MSGEIKIAIGIVGGVIVGVAIYRALQKAGVGRAIGDGEFDTFIFMARRAGISPLTAAAQAGTGIETGAAKKAFIENVTKAEYRAAIDVLQSGKKKDQFTPQENDTVWVVIDKLKPSKNG